MRFTFRRSMWIGLILLGTASIPQTTLAFMPTSTLSVRRDLIDSSSLVSPRFAESMDHQQEQQESPSRRTAVNTMDDAEEEAFLKQCKILCQERNIQFDKVKNARDLASIRNSNVQPGRIFRMGRVSDATESDIETLFAELNIRTLVDLRSPTELKDDPTLMREEVFRNFTDILWKEEGRKNPGCMRELAKDEGPIRQRFWQRNNNNNKEKDTTTTEMPMVVDYDENDDVEDLLEEECGLDEGAEITDISKPSRRERYFISLMNEFKYVKGTVSKLRKRDITKAILKSPGAMFSRRMRNWLKKPFLNEINDGGLPMLNELLLRFGAPGIRCVLELCANEERHPIAFYCTAGKDRTGMITAIILSLTGSKAEDIVEDYTLSANVYAEMNDHKAMVGALSQRNLDPKTFLGAPASVMRDTLMDIEENYGSVEEYCNWIGFGPEKQEQLRQACMKE